MRVRPLGSPALGLVAALAVACGDDATGQSASAPITGATTTPSGTDATDSSATATAPTTTTMATATDSGVTATTTDSTATDPTTTDALTSTTGTSGTTGEPATSITGVTLTDSSTGTDATTDTTTDTTGPGCPHGTLGCPCDGGTCEGALLCDVDLCVAPGDPVCGNGVVEAGEACDDGDDDELDGCTSACEVGPVCPAGSEGCPCNNGTCDPGLLCQGGACIAMPNAVCGNGVVEVGEACDDGNQQSFDACSNACTINNFGVDPCGFAQDGVWLNIDYKNAGSVYSPGWSYSNTPGYGELEWTANGKNWPEINLKGAVTLNQSDPIKPVADIGSGHWLRIMIGLGDLISYEYATVCITGRSISVGSSVTVDISNPAVGCGATTMVSNSWNLNPGGVDLGGNCLIAGNDFQAIQIQPMGGSSHLGLRTARITLHKPVF